MNNDKCLVMNDNAKLSLSKMRIASNFKKGNSCVDKRHENFIWYPGTNTTLIEMEAYAACVSWSSKHFTTFDGYSMSFDGKGTYTMVQECTSSDEPVYEVMIDMAYECPTGMPFCYTALKVRQLVECAS